MRWGNSHKRGKSHLLLISLRMMNFCMKATKVLYSGFNLLEKIAVKKLKDRILKLELYFCLKENKNVIKYKGNNSGVLNGSCS